MGDYSNITKTGPVLSSSGATQLTRSGQAGEVISQDCHGRYTEATYRGQIFCASNIAAQVLSLNSTTATGLILSNPTGSTRLLVLNRVIVSLASLPAGSAPLILTGNTNAAGSATVHTTPLVPQCGLVGLGTTPIGKVDSAATIANATILRIIPGGPAATVAGSTALPPTIVHDVGGSIILAPGTCISLQCLTAAISVLATFEWEEIPQ